MRSHIPRSRLCWLLAGLVGRSGNGSGDEWSDGLTVSVEESELIDDPDAGLTLVRSWRTDGCLLKAFNAVETLSELRDELPDELLDELPDELLDELLCRLPFSDFWVGGLLRSSDAAFTPLAGSRNIVSMLVYEPCDKSRLRGRGCGGWSRRINNQFDVAKET